MGRSVDVSAMSALADTSKLLDSFTFMKAKKGESIHKTYFGMAPIGQVCCAVHGITLHILRCDVFRKT